MSNEVAIRVDGLSKAYRIGLKEQRHETMLGALTSWVKSPLSNFRDLRKLSRFDDADAQPQVSAHIPHPSSGPARQPSAFSPHPSPPSPQLSPFIPQPSPTPSDIFWALKDISFELKRGEAVGIIGRNGAGKSTLLKILSRITEPTSGRAEIHGRVGSLLEVGTGFHPDLTGRENIYLNGTILGMKKREVDARFDEIVDFSGVEKFIDTPVKRYSSGMRVRLAFSVAAHLEPEIMIIDEVLAVGDAEFQKKCLGKMGDVAKQGRTVLFVSHNIAAIKALCGCAILLEQGRISSSGAVSDTISAYLTNTSAAKDGACVELEAWPDRYGTGQARILRARLLNDRGQETKHFRRADPLTLEFSFRSQCSSRLHLSAACTTPDGIRVMHLSHYDTPGFDPGVVDGEAKVVFRLPELPLFSGTYSWMLSVQTEHLESLDVVRGVLTFQMTDMAKSPRPFESADRFGFFSCPVEWTLIRS